MLAALNLDALWHDLECGGYREDLPCWRTLAGEAGGPVLDVGAGTGRVTLDLAARGAEVIALDVGAGTGRVTLDLAARGAEVIALDVEASLLRALARRAGGLRVTTVAADARAFVLPRRVALVLAPMQTLQLLGGPRGRTAFLRRALAHLQPGGVLAAAVADALDCFDDEHDLPPPPDACELDGALYSSRLLSVTDDDGRAVIHRRREIVGPGDRHDTEDAFVHLDRVSADEVAAEAAEVGFAVEPHRFVPQTDEYLGSTVVVLRAP